MQESSDTNLHNPSEEQASNQAPINEEKNTQTTPQKEGTAQNSPQQSTEKKDELVEDYSQMDLIELVESLEKLLNSGKTHQLKKSFDSLISIFNKKYNTYISSKKQAFIDEGGLEEDFEVIVPEKSKFEALVQRYKSERNTFYRELEKNLQSNLKIRLALIEELKGLIGVDQPIGETYKQFKSLQNQWHDTGHVPRAEANNLWRTYRHHVGIFYDFLHLNREFRELDYKYNYEQKLKVIEEAEALVGMEDIQKAFRNLQDLHKRWKDELGPVAKEHSEALWDRFGEATKIIHDKRQYFLKNQEKIFEENLQKKQLILEQIKVLIEEEANSHGVMQRQINKMEGLRSSFFAIGYVPKKDNESIWKDFKKIMQGFSRKRNHFYKNLKKSYSENLQRRLDIIKEAEELSLSDDYKTTTPKIIALQKKWKVAGAVSRKQNDKVWQKFRAVCNAYFDGMDTRRNKETKKEQEAWDKKSTLLSTIQNFSESNDSSEDQINAWISEWKNYGAVAKNKLNIESKFISSIAKAFKATGLSNEQIQKKRYELQLQLMADRPDALLKEKATIQRKIEEIKQQIIQLETNMQFFSENSSDNPIVIKVNQDIKKHRETLEKLEEKKKMLKSS
jgi:hypothetical protein